ncbi:hypothetical protein E4U21_003967 [Claviceps maximensis]|nr:hypothetical protein E4U21_003967 [Claviceps maximensis]
MNLPSFTSLRKFRSHGILRRAWPQMTGKGTAWLMLFELAGVVAVLTIFGLAQPDMYRSAMWEIGFQNKLNSNPNMVLYAYANYQPLPAVPLIWSQTLTDFNVAISVMSLFFLIGKLIAFIMKLWYPILATFINCAMVALYTVSTYGQIGPDYADARYPAPAAWYFRQGCDLARRYNKYKSCQVAQASLFATLYILVIYLCNLGFSIWAMMLNNRANNSENNDDDDFSTTWDPNKQSTWEMRNMKSPASIHESPFTPRTQAFRTLDRQLPLRQN